MQVTPDGQRTMRTALGASTELTELSALPEDWLPPRAAWLHCEGYCLYRPGFAREAMRAAKAAGATVSLAPSGSASIAVIIPSQGAAIPSLRRDACISSIVWGLNPGPAPVSHYGEQQERQSPHDFSAAAASWTCARGNGTLLLPWLLVQATSH